MSAGGRIGLGNDCPVIPGDFQCISVQNLSSSLLLCFCDSTDEKKIYSLLKNMAMLFST